jgi:preprotein translocase subunit SecF
MLAGLKSGTGRRESRREPLTGDELRAAVVGAGVSGRVNRAVSIADDDGEHEHEHDPHDDEARTTAVHRPADQLLTHPPRPRKKKRR